MKTWNQRPLEIRTLFNPGFCALILLRALQGFEEHDSEGMPFSLSLLVLPLSLHKQTRERLTASPRTRLLKLIEDHPAILVGLPARATDLVPFAFEALGYAMHSECFFVTQTGRLRTMPKALKKTVSGTAETVACQRAARTLGKQFAQIGDRLTIYASLGVRP